MNKRKITVTSLQMFGPPNRNKQRTPPPYTSIMRAIKPSVSFYRYLYNNVGGPWFWYERRQMDDETLRQIIQNPAIEVYVAYLNGVPAGYAELDCRFTPTIELAYFGLMSEFIGLGLGAYLLDWIIDRAWSYEPARFWVHTCTLDHPRALDVYQKAGFKIYKTETQYAPTQLPIVQTAHPQGV